MNRKSRRLGAALATLVVAGSIGAGGATAAEGDEINVLVESGGFGTLEQIAKNYEAETGTKVVLNNVPYISVFDQATTELANGGSTYDVILADAPWLPTFADFVEPLDDLFTDEVKADLFPALVDEAEFGGRFVGMPEWTNAEILLYRKDLFEDPNEQAAFLEATGRALTVPTTWEEFNEVARFFTRDTDGDGSYDFWGTDVKAGVTEEWLAHVLQAGSPGVALDDEGNVIVDNPEHQAALAFYIDLVCNGGMAPPGAAQVDWAGGQNLFYDGKTAMLRFWAHAYPLIPEEKPIFGKVGTAPMIGGAAGVAGIPGPWYAMVPAGAKDKDLSKDFVRYTYDHNALGIEGALGLAARKSAFEALADTPGYEHFGPLLETLAAEGTKARPAVPQWQEINDAVLLPTLQAAVTCQSDPADLLATARADIESILR